jgi:hypothetical protein
MTRDGQTALHPSPPWVGRWATLHPASSLSADRAQGAHANAPSSRRSIHGPEPPAE